jgi:hypothetical protein
MLFLDQQKPPPLRSSNLSQLQRMHTATVVSSSSSQRRRSHSRSARRPRGDAPTRARHAGHAAALPLTLGTQATRRRSGLGYQRRRGGPRLVVFVSGSPSCST